MAYYIGQAIGILVAIGAIINLQLKKKQHMYVLSLVVNFLSALNIFLLGQAGASGAVICLVANVQILFAIYHDKKHTDVTLAEKIIFFILYIAGGALGYKTPIDILSIVAAVFYMFAMFQKKEQNIRLFLLANMSSWTIYYVVIKSTAIFAQIAGIISSLIAMCRYRKKDKKIETDSDDYTEVSL